MAFTEGARIALNAGAVISAIIDPADMTRA
jgi:hypothetical protein